MSQNNRQFRHQSLQDADSIEQILRAVSDGLAKGKLRFGDDDGELLLHPRGLLDLRLTAEEDDGRQRISLRVSWQKSDKKSAQGKSLRIDSD